MTPDFIQTGDALPGNPGVRRPSAITIDDFYRSDEDATLGRNLWVIPGGNIPLTSIGPEPKFTSNETICLLNISPTASNIRITVYFEDCEPIGPFQLSVAPKRVRRVRFNDLIFPQAIPLGKPYSAVIQSDAPIIIQFTRTDTRQREATITGSMCYGID